MTRLARRATVLLLAFASLLTAAAARAESARDIRAILASGKPAVLVVSRTAIASDMKNEAYADWAAYLNEFAAGQRGTVRFLKIGPADLKTIFAESTPIRSRFATIFIRDARRALAYDGMIHERTIYRAAAAFLSGGEPATAELGGLRPFRFRLRQ